MELDAVRKDLNNYDDIIKNMITLRMSLIPIVADVKIKNNLPLFQGKREDEIYKNIKIYSKKNGVDENLVTDIYKLIIKNALNIEESIAENKENSILNKEVDVSKMANVIKEFEKIDYIVKKEIPEIISKITKRCELQNLNLNQVATLYYSSKIND